MTKTNKSNDIEKCRTWKDFRKFSENNGLPYEYHNGGHVYHKNEKGKMTFSAHKKEPSKKLRKDIIKQILAPITGVFFFIIVYPNMFTSNIV